MPRDFFVNGDSMVYVKGAAGSGIQNRQELGLAIDQVQITPIFHHKDITLNNWGSMAPAEVQAHLAEILVSMTLVDIDMDVLNTCMRESLGGTSVNGTLKRAGTRLGNRAARFAANNHYIGLNIASPTGQRPWRMYFSYLTNNPVVMPLGSDKSEVSLNWRVVPYTTDPWGAGLGSEGLVIYDHVLDT